MFDLDICLLLLLFIAQLHVTMKMLTSIFLDMNSCGVVKKKVDVFWGKANPFPLYAHSQDAAPCISAHQNLEKLNLKPLWFQTFLWSVNSFTVFYS